MLTLDFALAAVVGFGLIFLHDFFRQVADHYEALRQAEALCPEERERILLAEAMRITKGGK